MPIARDLVNIQQSRVPEEGWKCRQTDSIGFDGDGLPRQESIGLASCQFARDLVNIQQSRVPEEGLDSIGSDGDGLPWQNSIGFAACQFARDLVNIQQSRVPEDGLAFPVPVAIGLNPPAGEDNPTQVGCIGHV